MRLYGLVMHLIGLLPLYNSESWLNVTVCLMTYVTEREKTGLMYTKYISLYYGTYLLYCSRY